MDWLIERGSYLENMTVKERIEELGALHKRADDIHSARRVPSDVPHDDSWSDATEDPRDAVHPILTQLRNGEGTGASDSQQAPDDVRPPLAEGVKKT